MVLNFIAYLAIPISTLLFAGPSQWLTTNFSVLGNQLERRLFFALWGLLVGLYFGHCVHHLIPRMGGKRWLYRMRAVGLIFLFFAITTPYIPQSMPLKAFFHTFFSVCAVCLLLLILLQLLVNCWRHSPRQTTPYLVAVLLIASCSLTLLLVAGMVSSALEVFITIATTLLVRQMLNISWQVNFVEKNRTNA